MSDHEQEQRAVDADHHSDYELIDLLDTEDQHPVKKPRSDIYVHYEWKVSDSKYHCKYCK
jgi:hypothetical protein